MHKKPEKSSQDQPQGQMRKRRFRGWTTLAKGYTAQWQSGAVYLHLFSDSKLRDEPCSDHPSGSDGKVSACSVGDPGSISRLGRSPGGGNGNPLQYLCLENPMDRGAW